MGVISTSVYANTALQSVKVTVNHKNAPISKVLDDIEQQTGYSILVRNNDINIKQKVTVNVTGSLNTVLADVFEGMEVKYNVENKTISIYKEKTPSFVASSVNQDKNSYRYYCRPKWRTYYRSQCLYPRDNYGYHK